MCGIFCCITRHGAVALKKCDTCPLCSSAGATQELQRIRDLVSRRGPDFSSEACYEVGNGDIPVDNGEQDKLWIHVKSDVLWTQGVHVYSQPFTNEVGSKFMLFNGDIYSFNGFPEESVKFDEDDQQHSMRTNDGITLFKLLETVESPEEICKVIGNIQGPFAFVFVDKAKGHLWFSRDFFGRESLIFSYECNVGKEVASSWVISSVSVFKNTFEVPTSGLFFVDINSRQLKLFPYSHFRESVSTLQSEFFSVLKSSGFVEDTDVASNFDSQINLHFSLKLKQPTNQPESQHPLLHSLINTACSVISAEDFIQTSTTILSKHIDLFLHNLRCSVIRRVSTIPPYCKNCMCSKIMHPESQLVCSHAKVGVLFSGGVDSTVLAYLAAENLPVGSILDLINVEFSKDDNFNKSPDRETALQSYKMLKEKFESEGKIINLVLVNVTKSEVSEKRGERIADLILPLKSVLDDSIGVCLWFAARGKGYIYGSSTQTQYISPVRVVLLGSGADELLGGYSRHRSAYENLGWLGLVSEMQLDIDRISIRNLGRDNRIVSDHGICPRMPFLDENVVDFLTRQCEVWVKCCPVNAGPLGSRGSGEKLLLRAVAAKLFGDQYLSLALFPKRAMQFGSRIAKLENSKEKGGDFCQRLL